MAQDHQGAFLYNATRALGAPFRYRVVGLENIRDGGPAIFIANHLGSLGPIESILSLPVRFYPWIRAEMTDLQRAAAYLHGDFVGPEWQLRGRVGLIVSGLLSQVTVRLINRVGSVAVEGAGYVPVEAYRRSLALLIEGKNLLIFPEDNVLPADPQTGLHPFQCGFVGLCSMYRRASGAELPIYPMAVHSGNRAIAVGKAAYLVDEGNHREGVRATCSRLREEIASLYLALESSAIRV